MFRIMDTKKKVWWCFTPKAVGLRVECIAGRTEGSRAGDWAKTARPGEKFALDRCTVEFVEVV